MSAVHPVLRKRNRSVERSLLALNVVRGHAQKSVAIGGGADMDDRAAMADSDANDPTMDLMP